MDSDLDSSRHTGAGYSGTGTRTGVTGTGNTAGTTAGPHSVSIFGRLLWVSHSAQEPQGPSLGVADMLKLVKLGEQVGSYR